MEQMVLTESTQVESDSIDDFTRIMRGRQYPGLSRGGEGERLNLDQQSVKNGLGRLVLTLIKLLHELLERQAVRRMEAGSLTAGQTEELGIALMGQAQEIERLRKEFGLEDDDLNLDLGPLGKLL